MYVAPEQFVGTWASVIRGARGNQRCAVPVCSDRSVGCVAERRFEDGDVAIEYNTVASHQAIVDILEIPADSQRRDRRCMDFTSGSISAGGASSNTRSQAHRNDDAALDGPMGHNRNRGGRRLKGVGGLRSKSRVAETRKGGRIARAGVGNSDVETDPFLQA